MLPPLRSGYSLTRYGLPAFAQVPWPTRRRAAVVTTWSTHRSAEGRVEPAYGQPSRWKAMIQLVSQVRSPSMEKACSQRAEVSVISDQR